MTTNLWKTLPVLAFGIYSITADQKLTPSDLEHGRLFLEQSRTGVVGATKGLSEAQWNFKPAPDRWSIAEILEHIVVTQDLVLGPVTAQLKAAPLTNNADAKTLDGIIMNQFADRTNKFQAPDILRPTGRWTPEASLERMKKNYGRLIDCLESTPDLRKHMVDAPPIEALSKGAFKSLDGYEWIVAAGAHAERHTKQMLEVKADARFPLR